MQHFYHDFTSFPVSRWGRWAGRISGTAILIFAVWDAFRNGLNGVDDWMRLIGYIINGLIFLLIIGFGWTVWKKEKYIFRITDEGIDLHLPTSKSEPRFIPIKQITKAQLLEGEVLIYLQSEPPERFDFPITRRKMQELRQAFRKINVPVHDMMEGKVYA